MDGTLRPLPKLVLVLFAVVAAVLAGWWIAKQLAQAPLPTPAAVSKPEAVGRVAGKRTVHLYFGDAQGRHLMAEQRVVTPPADDIALARLLVTMLIQGPETEARRTLPADARLRALHLTESGTAFVDFEEDALAGHPGGAGGEMLTIYSVVNTLALNVDTIRTVKFLIGGQEAATLVDHVDLREPFEVDMLWVR